MAVRNLVIIILAIAVASACHTITAKQRFSNLFAEAVTKVDEFSLKPVSERELFESAMKGMLKSLDAHSDYVSGKQYEEDIQRRRQQFGGVGMYVMVHPRTFVLTVTCPMPNSPAFKGGLRPGDAIVSIDKFPIQLLEPGEADELSRAEAIQDMRDDAIQRMHGIVGQPVTLTIRRPPAETTFEVTLTREMIPTQTVLGDVRKNDGTWDYFLPEDPRVAYINIVEFSERTQQELVDILQRIKPQAQALILDLRTNGGGLLDQAVAISDMFLNKPVKIVEVRGRQNRLTQPPYIADSAVELDEHIPIALLVDGYTASASEIVAACLQDNHRAIVIGEQTYGKGTVQDLIPLERGRSHMKITTATYWRPSGRNIDKANGIEKHDSWGVQPDPGFRVELTKDEFIQVIRLRYQRQYRLFNMFDEAPTDKDTPPAADNAPNSSRTLTEDPFLKRAIEHLSQTLDGKNST